MATVSAGSVASVYCPLASTVTVTPGFQAVVRVENPRGSDSFAQKRISTVTSFSVVAGETMFIEAVGQDATYTEPDLGTADRVSAASRASAPTIAAQCLRSGRSAVGWSLTNNSGASGSMAITSSGSPFGYPALKVTIPNDTGSVDVIADELVTANWTAGRANLVVHVYVDDELGIKQIRPYVGNDTSLTRNMDRTYNLSNDNVHRSNGHHVISINPDNATANTMNSTDGIGRLRLRINGQPAGGAIWIEGVYVPDPVTPWMVITCDDADITLYTKFHAELMARGLHGTFGVNWDQVGSNDALYVTQAQLQAMYDYGHDICSHNRANTAYPDETPPTAQPGDADRLTYCTAYRYTRNRMRELGWTRGLGFHPFVQGAHDGALVDSMKAHGATLTRNAGTARQVEPFRLNLQSVIGQRPLGSASTLATAKGWIDSAVTRSQDVVLMGHILGPTAADSVTWAQTDFGALLDYAVTSGVRVGSVSEWCFARGVSV